MENRNTDPSVADEVEFSLDFISLKSIITSSLGKLYGLIGEASHFDILEIRAKKLIIRIQPQDVEKFRNSFMAFTFNASKFGVSTSEVSCFLKVNKSSPHLGLAVDEDFI